MHKESQENCSNSDRFPKFSESPVTLRFAFALARTPESDQLISDFLVGKKPIVCINLNFYYLSLNLWFCLNVNV